MNTEKQIDEQIYWAREPKREERFRIFSHYFQSVRQFSLRPATTVHYCGHHSHICIFSLSLSLAHQVVISPFYDLIHTLCQTHKCFTSTLITDAMSIVTKILSIKRCLSSSYMQMMNDRMRMRMILSAVAFGVSKDFTIFFIVFFFFFFAAFL